jgi:small subunit ribosomal protein S6
VIVGTIIMRLYESTFLVRQDVSPQAVGEITNQFTALIESYKGKVVKKEDWGLRSLAYRIKKNKKAYFVMLIIEAGNDAMAELKRQYKLNEDILRDLTVSIEEVPKAASPMINERPKSAASAA